jgi:glycosyltransferase involved in cell wall biosynthesis
MKNGLVSVIIPAYNAGYQLKEAMESVLRQTYSNLELIIVNDGSPNKITEETALSVKDPRVKYIRQENSGNYVARNRGIREAQGEYIAHQDHDDLWVEDKLEKQLAVFQKNQDLGFCCTDHYIFFKDETKKLYRDKLHTFKDAFLEQKTFIEELIQDNFVILSSVMVRRSCIDQLGGFDTNDNYSMDYEFNLRMALNYRAHYMKERTVLRRIHPMNLSNKSAEMLESVLYVLNKVNSCIEKNRFYEPKQKALLGERIQQNKYRLGVEYLSVKNYAKALRYLEESGYTEKSLFRDIAIFVAKSKMGLFVPLIKLYRTSKKNKYVIPVPDAKVST